MYARCTEVYQQKVKILSPIWTHFLKKSWKTGTILKISTKNLKNSYVWISAWKTARLEESGLSFIYLTLSRQIWTFSKKWGKILFWHASENLTGIGFGPFETLSRSKTGPIMLRSGPNQNHILKYDMIKESLGAICA